MLRIKLTRLRIAGQFGPRYRKREVYRSSDPPFGVIDIGVMVCTIGGERKRSVRTLLIYSA